MSYQNALKNFIANATDFQAAVDSSTMADLDGDLYAVVLRKDGTYTTWWGKALRRAEGDIVVPVPPLVDEDWDEDPDLRYYGNAQDQIAEDFLEIMESMIEA